MRADLALVEAGLCSSRAQARQLIESGQVSVRTAKGLELVKKASQNVILIQDLKVSDAGPRFVSRGGLKLYHALESTKLCVQGSQCMDFGQSTGGFTDCLLQLGAKSVIGFDVGHDQLHHALKGDSRVIAYEAVNLKDIDAQTWLQKLRALGPEYYPVNLAVADLSFISLKRVLPSILSLLDKRTTCLFLVKPQFELGKEHIGKNGLVKKAESKIELLKEIMFESLEANYCKPVDFFECEIKGGDGNQEFFVHALWDGASSNPSLFEEEQQ